MPDDQAIVVGVSRYPILGDLAGPENDANDFADWLCSSEGGGVPANNVTLVLSPRIPAAVSPLKAEPTTSALEEAFDALYDLGDQNNGKAGRRLYLYLAGHGFAPTLEDAALLMANAARGRVHHLAGRPYANWFRRSAFFDEVVLFMDCCRENYPRSPVRPCHLDTINGPRLARHFYGLATEWSRAAREAPDDDGVVHGLFTTALLAGLRGGASEPGGEITGASLERFVFNFLQKLQGNGERQEPKFDYDHMNDITFTVGDAPPEFTLRVHVAGEAEVEVLDGNLRPVAPSSAEAGVREWRLGLGLYVYGRAGGPRDVLELLAPGRVVDVQL
jgi:hypothetical protein